MVKTTTSPSQTTTSRPNWARQILLPSVALAAIAVLGELALSGGFAGAVAADRPVAIDSVVDEPSADIAKLASSAEDASTDSTAECVVGTTSGPTIAIRLRGSTGDEEATLVVTDPAGAVVRVAVPVSSQFEVQSFAIPTARVNQSVRIEFTNDQNRDPQYDRNVTVDWLEICGERFGTDVAESSGIWSSGEGCQTVRFGAGNTLHCNGFFAWGTSPSSPSTVTVTVTARGVTGEEILDVRFISGANIGEDLTSIPLTPSLQDYSFEVPRSTHVSDLNFEFNNDKYIHGVVDRNLIIHNIVFDGRTIDTLNPRTFVTGHYKYGECQSGNNNEYLNTTVIECNGSFNFERGDPSLDQR